MEHDRSIAIGEPKLEHSEILAGVALANLYVNEDWNGIKDLGYSKKEIKDLKRRKRRKIRKTDITKSPEVCFK